MVRELILVHERHDEEGDMLFLVTMTTYSRSALDRLRDTMGLEFVYVAEDWSPHPDSDDLDLLEELAPVVPLRRAA